MEKQKSAPRRTGARQTARAALALLLLMGALSLLLQPARASVWQDGIWQGESVALTTDDGFIVSAQEDTADFSAEFKPAENQDGYVVLEIDVSVRNGATGQTIQDLEFRYENELIASVESVNARSSTLVETNVVPQTSTLNAPNKCPCILRFSCMIFSLSVKTGGYGLTQFSCPANALYGVGLK